MYSDQLLLPSNLFVPQALCALRPVEHKIIESIAPICTWKVRKSFESYCGTWECDEDDDYATDEASWSFLPIASLELPSWESGHGAKKPPLFEATKTVPQLKVQLGECLLRTYVGCVSSMFLKIYHLAH